LIEEIQANAINFELEMLATGTEKTVRKGNTQPDLYESSRSVERSFDEQRILYSELSKAVF